MVDEVVLRAWSSESKRGAQAWAFVSRVGTGCTGAQGTQEIPLPLINGRRPVKHAKTNGRQDSIEDKTVPPLNRVT